MKGESETPREIMATVERRFQFVIILALFLPFVWNDLLKIYPSTYAAIFDGQFSFVGVVISYICLGYFIFEFFRRIIRPSLLSAMSWVLLLLSYTLIVVISFALTQTQTLDGYKFILTETSVLGDMVFPVLIVGLASLGPIMIGGKWIKEHLKR